MYVLTRPIYIPSEWTPGWKLTEKQAIAYCHHLPYGRVNQEVIMRSENWWYSTRGDYMVFRVNGVLQQLLCGGENNIIYTKQVVPIILLISKKQQDS